VLTRSPTLLCHASTPRGFNLPYIGPSHTSRWHTYSLPSIRSVVGCELIPGSMSALAPELVSPTIRKRLNNSLDLDSIADGSTPGIAADTLASKAHTEVSKLWLLSRRTAAPGRYRPPGEERPFTLQNVRLAIRLLQLSGPRPLRMFMAGQEWRMVLYVLWTFSRGVLPTWR
jgi:hypothetical protein